MRNLATKATDLILWFREPGEFFRALTGWPPIPPQLSLLNRLPDPNFKRMLISAPGEAGKTLLLSVAGLWQATVLPYFTDTGYQVAIISGSARQSQQLYGWMKKFLRQDIFTDELAEEPLVTITRFKSDSEIRALPNSPKAIRGGHPHMIPLDEGVEAGDETLLMAQQRVSWRPYSRIIISSTPHRFDSLFVEMWLNKTKYSMWERLEWSWRDCPWKSQEEYEIAVKTQPQWIVEVEWEGKPFAEMIGKFLPDDVRDARKDDKPVWIESAKVVIGIDWGYHLPTAIVVIQWVGDVAEILYAVTYSEKDPEFVAQKIKEIADSYRCSTVFADSSHIQENLRLQHQGVRVQPIIFKNERGWLEGQLTMLLKTKKIRIWNGFGELLHQLFTYNPETTRSRDLADALLLAVRRTSFRPSKWFFKVGYQGEQEIPEPPEGKEAKEEEKEELEPGAKAVEGLVYVGER